MNEIIVFSMTTCSPMDICGVCIGTNNSLNFSCWASSWRPENSKTSMPLTAFSELLMILSICSFETASLLTPRILMRFFLVVSIICVSRLPKWS